MRSIFATIALLLGATPLLAAAPGFHVRGVARLGTAGADDAARVAYGSDGYSYVAFTEAPAEPGGGVAPANSHIRLARFKPDGKPDWSVTLEGAKADWATGVAVAADGNIYVVGYSLSGFQAQPNAGAQDVLLASFDANGKKRWIALLGGTGRDFAEGLAPGPAGGVYVVGWTDSAEVGNQANGGGIDALVARFETNGKLTWVRLDGGANDAYASAIDVARSGSVFVAGYVTQPTPSTNFDITLRKYLPSGTAVFTRALGGRKDDTASAVSVAPNGWIYVAGDSESHTLAGNANRGGIDIVLAKYHSSGKRAWVKLAGGTGDDFARAVDSPLKNAVYVAGITRSNLSGPPRALDGLLLRFDARGHPPLIKQFGGAGNDEVRSVAVSRDTVLIGGVTDSARLLGATSLGLNDSFVARFR